MASCSRQGCSRSVRVAFCAFALGPLIRRLMAHRMLATARLFAHADGCEPPSARASAKDGTSSQIGDGRFLLFSLKASECVFWDGGDAEMRTFLQGAVGLHSARAERAARYPVVTVGTDSRGALWNEMAAKLGARARDVAACGASWPTRLRLFRIHCTSLVRYRAQISGPGGVLVRADRSRRH